jgi:hypothetical protein
MNFEAIINSCDSASKKRYRSRELRLTMMSATAAAMEPAATASETGLPA